MSAADPTARRARVAALLAELLDVLAPVEAPPTVAHYDETNSPTRPTSRRAWREWCARHGVPTMRAGAHLLARRADVDAALEKRRPAPAALELDDDAALLARAGLRVVGGRSR